MEDIEQDFQLFVTAIQFARTPQTKKGAKEMGRALSQFRKGMTRVLTPWVEERRVQEIKERLSKPPSGVVLDEEGKPVDLNDPEWIYK